MDINTLKQIVKDALSEGKYALGTAKLSSKSIDSIAKDFLPKSTLNIEPDKDPFSETADSITVKGKGMDDPFKTMTIEARFYILNDQAALTLTAKGAADWKLDKAFPVFAKNLGAQVVFAQTPAPPSLFLLSDKDDKYSEGMTFAGSIDFSKMSAGVASMLGISNELLKGAVHLKNGGKDFESIDFKGTEHKNVNLWIAKDCTVQLNMLSFALPNPLSKTTGALPYIQLKTIFPFSANTKKYELPVAMSITSFKKPMRFEADITSLVDATLDALSAFAGGADLQKTLPPPSEFHLENILRFKQLYVDIDVEGKKVRDVGMLIGSTSDWKIMEVKSTGKKLYAKDVNLGFVVIDPFAGGKPNAYLNLSGGIQLTEKATLLVAASYPNFRVTGYLAENAEFKIKDFIEQFAGPSPAVPDLEISTLEFNLASGDYSFAVETNGFWPINDSKSLALIINELGFNLAYKSGALDAGFYGTLMVGKVAISITADYTSNAEKKGWKFTGKTGEGQKIPFGEFVTYLAKTFNAGEPPKWVKEMYLQDLDTSLETDTKNFTFHITGTIPLANNNKLVIKPGFEMKQLEKKEEYEKIFSCDIFISKAIFHIKATSSPSETSFEAGWEAKDKEGYLQIADIAHAFGFDEVPEIPEGLDLALKEAKLYYDATKDKESLVLAAASANYGNAVFVAKKLDGAWTYIFGIEVSPTGIDLAHLPLVGADMEKIVGPVALKNFKIVIATKDIKDENVKDFNKLIADHAGKDYPTIPEVKEGVQAGVYAAIELLLGKSNTYEIQVSTAKKKPKPEVALVSAAAASATDKNVYWLNLQKNIGPVYLDKVGVGYQSGRVALMLDASLIFAALKINMIELGASAKLNDIKHPSFELNGLTLAFETGPVKIAGGFLKKEVDGLTQYFGSAAIGVKAFNLSALGAYANVDGHPSLFIFAMLTSPPLGGPPAFFITGLAAGFGYNRGLNLPSVDDVATFPLVSGMVPGQENPFKNGDPNDALKVLVDKKVVPVQIGQNWLAAGIQFTSFELLQSYALLSVAFGTNLEIGLLGMSTVSVPPKSPKTLAFAQLALAVRILPDKGLVAVDAKLTPASYIISKDAKLTGGFSFYLWTSPNEFAGDFVVTLGGYHPNFEAPAYYPKVPRLGLNWVINSEISIKGGLYFALTPACLMAGGSMEATFKSGGLKAWFNMGVDFLIAWKPFHYEAALYLSFGVSYTFSLDLLFTTVTKTITVSLGADLSVWGPEFAGVANIHLWIISFKISFGATTKTETKTISWDEFKQSFLPPVNPQNPNRRLLAASNEENELTTTFCSSKVSRGLVLDLSRSAKTESLDWIVSRNHTTFDTGSLIPAKTYQLIIKDVHGFVVPASQIVVINQKDLDDRNLQFGVGMVDVENDDFHSDHVITLKYDEALNPEIKYEVKAVISSVPKSMWDKAVANLKGDSTVEDVLTGFSITPLAPTPDESVPIALENFQYHFENYPKISMPNRPVIIPGPDDPDPMAKMMETINKSSVSDFRKKILENLKSRQIDVETDVQVKEIAESGRDYIFGGPVLEYNYWKNK